MSFWDGRTWLPETPPVAPLPRPSRLRDWAATGAMALVLGAILLPWTGAFATGPALRTSPNSAPSGSSIAVVGSGFSAKTKVQLTWDGSADGMPSVTVNAKGTFKATVTVPKGPDGPHTIDAVQLLSSTGKASKAAQLGAILASSVFVLSTAATTSAAPTPDPTPTPTATATATPAPTPTPTPKPSATATPAPTATSTATPAPTATPVPTATPAPTATPTPTPAPAAFVTACGTSLCLSGHTWYLYGASQLGGMDDPAARASLAVAGGLNTLRVVNFLDEGGAPATAPYNEPRWQRVDGAIAAARAQGLHVILDLSTYRNLLWNSGANPYTTDWQPFLSFVANRVNTVNGLRYADDPTIAIMAFAGEVEPINTPANDRGITTSQVTSFFKRTFAEWKALDPNHLTSSGGFLQIDWDSGIDWKAIFSLADNDVCSIHDYSVTDQTVTTPAVANYCGGLGKPWITEEFGWEQALGDATRSDHFADMYALQRTFHAAGVGNWNLGTQVGGTTYDVNKSTPLTWAVMVANAP